MVRALRFVGLAFPLPGAAGRIGRGRMCRTLSQPGRRRCRRSAAGHAPLHLLWQIEQIAWGRLYMEVVEQDGADIDQMVRDTYRPPTTE